ncbi:hypothetical protein Tco_1525137, partial [Tanacetum coccineum]
LPDPETDSEGYKVISEMMVHGPCGPTHKDAVCMNDGNCSKKIPKKYNKETYFDKNGHAHYRRRETSYINVEYCGWSMLIKYLFKYISKGTDRIFEKVTKPNEELQTRTEPERVKVDKLQNYIDGCYICPHEACWRILKFDIHSRYPAVQILCVQQENMQSITFRDRDSLDSIVNDEGKKKTTLTEWLAYNKAHTNGHHLTYVDFPKEFVWYADTKTWSLRKRKGPGSVGRLVYVHPTLGLLGDGKEWHTALEEASFSSTPT